MLQRSILRDAERHDTLPHDCDPEIIGALHGAMLSSA